MLVLAHHGPEVALLPAILATLPTLLAIAAGWAASLTTTTTTDTPAERRGEE